jgi:hypothetical protein
VWSRREPLGQDDTENRNTEASKGGPSWLDYLDALKIEGRRYRPASLRAVLEKREREAGKPRASDEGQK